MRRPWKQAGLGLFLLGLMGDAAWVQAALLELPLDPEPASNAKAPVSVGVDYSGVLDRHLGGGGSGASRVTSGRITKSDQVHAKIVYALHQYLNLYAKAGLADWSEKLLFNNGGKSEINFDYGFSWGLGATGAHQFSKGWQIFYDVQYLSTENANVKRVTQALRTVSSQTGEGNLQQFHLAGGLGYQFHTYYEWASVIFPYVGVRYSSLTVKHQSVSWRAGAQNFSVTSDIEEDGNFGLIAGIQFGNDTNLTLRLEGRLLDETAFGVSVDYRF